MIIEEYIQDRLDKQITWYEEKSKCNKFRYRITEIIIITSGALIPLINSSSILSVNTNGSPQEIPWSGLIFISSLLGFIITIVTGFSKMEKYFETWILYRTNAEILKREKFLYLNNAGHYYNLNQENRNNTLVDIVEKFLAEDVTKYFSMQSEARKSISEERKTDQVSKTSENSIK